MATVNDRRSSMSKQESVEKDAGVDRRKDGSIRRITPGIRSLRDFFDQEQAEKTMTRGDVVNTISALWYYERESKWWRRLWRAIKRYPQVYSVLDDMADAHAKGLEVAKEQMEEQVAQAQKAAQAFRGGQKS